MAPDPALGRRERRKRELHDRILRAGGALFDELGFDATTVAAVCEQADVAHKTFFNHFPTKQHLVRELALEAVDSLLLEIEEVRKAGRTTPERLRLFFSHLADNAEAAGPMHRELLTEMIHAAHGSEVEALHARRLHDAFRALVADGRAGGDLRRDFPVETLTDSLVGTFYSLMFNFAHVEDYPLRRHALAAARFLASALAEREESGG